MAKLNVGDKVIIKKLETNKKYDGSNYTCNMSRYAGKVATIVSVTNTPDKMTVYYSLDVDACRYAWSEEMLKLMTVPDICIKITRYVDEEGRIFICANDTINNRRAKAICKPWEVYNEEKGVLLAISRLYGNSFKEQELDKHIEGKALNGWYICKKTTNNGFLKDIVYYFVNNYCKAMNITVSANKDHFEKVELNA